GSGIHCSCEVPVQGALNRSAFSGRQFRDLLTYAGSHLLGRGANWIVLAGLAAILEPSEYGVVGLIVAVEAISIGAFSLGQNRTLLRYAGEVPQPRDALVTGLAISTTCLIAAAVLFITVAS